MGNLLGRAKVIEELRDELARTEAALQKHLESAAHELDAEQKKRKAAENEIAASLVAADVLRAQVTAVRADEALALESVAEARKAHDEHALLVKRILTAQQKYGVTAAWPGVKRHAAATGTAAAELARVPSARALARAEAAAARLGDLGGEGARSALAEAEDDKIASMLWPRPLGDYSVALRGGRTLATLGVRLQPDTANGSSGLGGSAFDTARIGAGILHRLPLGAAFGLSVIYDPVSKAVEEGSASLLIGRAAASGAYATAASTEGGLALAHALASVDHTGELSLGARWLISSTCRVETRSALDVNSKRMTKMGAHITITI
mmetsp:Transcript_40568/g.100231  ORF Transcript_40568/g.100231 Transcript_40568/m.100231 type:complete len:323 (-) Transcript_40568:437-1405(-)